MILLLTILAAALIFLNVLRLRDPIPKENRIPEIDGRVPILQHLPLLKKLGDNHLEFFRKCTDKYGKTWQFWVPSMIPGIIKPFAVVFTADPEILKFVLSTGFKEGLFDKGEIMMMQHRDFLGKGIFVSNGERWKSVRNFASGLFHVDGLRQYVDIFHSNCLKLFTVLDKIKEKPEGIDIQDYFMRYTLDSFAEIGFGVQLGSISAETHQFAQAFDVVQFHSMYRGASGRLWVLKEFFSKPKLFFQNLDYMNNYVYGIINTRKSEPIEQLQDRQDLLSRLLVANKDISKEDSRDFVMNFLLAGRDTTAVLLTWSIYLLSSHPDVVRKLLAEFREYIAEDETPTLANTKSLVYTKMVLQEVLRLYPPVPIDGYDATKDCTLPNGFKVSKETQIRYCGWDLHRRPELWGEDAEEFRPERFEHNPAPFTYVPFHLGPRECLGKEMAYLEAKIALVNFLRKYSFTHVPGQKIETKQGIILTAKYGIRMHLVERKSLNQSF